MGGLPVDEVWSLDCVNQGDAALLNENNLGDSCESTAPVHACS